MSHTVETKTERIDPDLARYMLDNMIVNRPASKPRVTAYAGDMLNGDWVNNGETIKMTPDGKLIDGQHRLLAVIESGCTVEFTVAYNVTLDMIPTIDAGRPRTVNDYLRMTGHASVTEVTAAVRLLAMYEDVTSGGSQQRVTRGGLTQVAVLHLLEKHPDLHQYATQASRVAIACQLPKSVTLTAIYLTRDHPKWIDFWGGVESGVGLTINDPRGKIRKLGSAINANRRRSVRFHMLGLIIKAWNLYVEDRTVQLLILKESEKFPTVHRSD